MTLVLRVLRLLLKGLWIAFMLVIVLGVAWGSWWSLSDWRLERQTSTTSNWDAKELPGFPYTFTLKTRCSKSRLFYIFTVEPKSQGAPTDPSRQQPGWPKWAREFDQLIAEVEFLLRDSDGFDLVLVKVKKEDFIYATESNAMSVNTTTSCDRDAYSRAAEWGPRLSMIK